MATPATLQLLEKIAADLSREDLVFPTSFNITLKVRDLLRDPDISIEKLAKALQTEPIISTKLIKMANSAALGPASGSPVRDLNGAIMRLGLDAVKSVAFTVAMEQLVRSKHMAAHTGLSAKIWEHSIYVAAIARQIAKHFKRVKPDEAFFAGLVHDIGAFYLLFYASQDAVLSQSPEEILDLMIHWHDGIGHALLDALGQQSEELLTAVQDHESTAPIKQLSNLSEILCVANRLANLKTRWHPAMNDLDASETEGEPDVDTPLDAELMQSLLESSQQDVEELRSTLSI